MVNDTTCIIAIMATTKSNVCTVWDRCTKCSSTCHMVELIEHKHLKKTKGMVYVLKNCIKIAILYGFQKNKISTHIIIKRCSIMDI